jgi:hypothetical protein
VTLARLLGATEVCEPMLPPKFSVDGFSYNSDEADDLRLLSSRDNPVGYLTFAFRLAGLPVNSIEKNKWWTAYNVLVLLFLLCSYFMLIYYNTRYPHEIYSGVALYIFGISALCAYAMISWSSFKGSNILQLLQIVAAREENSYGRQHSTPDPTRPPHEELQYMCNRWLLIATAIGALSYLLITANDSSDDFLKDNVAAWIILRLSYLLFTVAWLLPLVLIRVSCYFLEKRINELVKYVEGISDLRAARIEDMMDW